MARVYLSLGSNIERRRNLRHALDALHERYGPLTCSDVYESEAVGFDSDPFYNLVVGFDTDETPRDIQQALHAMESASGRLRSGELAARTLDLDLLLYDDVVNDEPGLVLPRDDINRYAFVLRPLAESYDLVVLDCPPSISLVSENIFRAADALLLPTIPTTLSRSFTLVTKLCGSMVTLLPDWRRTLYDWGHSGNPSESGSTARVGFSRR